MNASILTSKLPAIAMATIAITLFLSTVYTALRHPETIEARLQRFYHPRTFAWLVATAVFLSLLGLIGVNAAANWQYSMPEMIPDQERPFSVLGEVESKPAVDFWQPVGPATPEEPGLAVIVTEASAAKADSVSSFTTVASATAPTNSSSEMLPQTAVFMTNYVSDLLLLLFGTLSVLPIGILLLIGLAWLIAARSSQSATESGGRLRTGIWGQMLRDRFANSLLAVVGLFALGVLLSLGVI